MCSLAMAVRPVTVPGRHSMLPRSVRSSFAHSSQRSSSLPTPPSARRLSVTVSAAASETVVDSSKVAMISSIDEYQQALSEADGLVVLNIGSKLCGPCKLIAPYVAELSQEFEEAAFLKINGDTNKETVAMMKEWGVKSVPEFRFFKGGEEVHKHAGTNKDLLRAAIEEHI